jgi:magnesium-transporting ATPase (P-type)
MGKEGNQASAFADYAIPSFRHLRRLLFWHGRSFGSKLNNMTLWVIFKRMIFGSSCWMFNLWSGLSGIHTIDNFIWAMYPVCLTNISVGWMPPYENFISWAKFAKSEEDEKRDPKDGGLPFKLSHFYAVCRQEMQNFGRDFFIYWFYGWWVSLMLVGVFYNQQHVSGGIFSDDGKTMGAYTFGVYLAITASMIHHVHVGISIRDWNRTYIGIFLLQLTMVVFILWVNDNMKKSFAFGTCFNYLFRTANFWFIFVFPIVTAIMPIYAADRFYSIIIMPKFRAVQC